MSGFKRLFSPRSAVGLVKDLLKITLTGVVAWVVLKGSMDDLVGLTGASPGHGHGRDRRASCMKVGFALAAVYVVIALADLIFERWQHEKDLRMTKEEVKREAKEADVNPEVKGQLKRRQHEMAVRRMMSAVPDADVVITNPTHYAVALRVRAVAAGAAGGGEGRRPRRPPDHREGPRERRQRGRRPAPRAQPVRRRRGRAVHPRRRVRRRRRDPRPRLPRVRPSSRRPPDEHRRRRPRPAAAEHPQPPPRQQRRRDRGRRRRDRRDDDPPAARRSCWTS